MTWVAAILSITLLAAVGIGILWRQRMQLAAARERAFVTEREAIGKHLDLLSRHANDIILLVDSGGRIVEANERAVQRYEYPREEIIGMPATKLGIPQERSSLADHFAEIRQRLSGTHESLHVTRSDKSFPVEVSGHLVETTAGQYVQVIIRDISERRHQDERIARLTHIRKALSEVNRAIVHAVAEDALYAEICAIAVRHAGFVLAWIGVPDTNSGAVFPLTSAGAPAGLDYLGRVGYSYRDTPEGRGPTGAAIREGHTILTNDFLGDSRNAPWHEAARNAGIRASAALPLRRDGEVVAVLGVYSGIPDYFEQEIVDLLEEMVQDVSFSLGVLARDRERKAALARTVELTEIVNRSPAVFYRVRAAPGWPVEIISESVGQFGYTPQDLLSGRVSIASIVHPDDLPRINAGAERFGERMRDMVEQQYRIRTRSGKTRWVDDRTWAVRGEDGSIVHFQGLILDVTEHHRAQQELQFKNTVLATQQETSPDAILVVDENGMVLSRNRQFLELWGIPEELARAGVDEPILRTAVSLMRDPEQFLARVRYLYDHKEQKSHDELQMKDGRIVERHSSPMIGSGGKYHGRVWYFRDITERKHAELALRDSEQRFRAMVEQSISGFYMIENEKFAYVNSRFAEIFGYASPEEIVGKGPMELTAPQNRAIVAENIRRRLAGEAKDLNYSFTGLRKDGTEVEVGVHGSAAIYEGRPVLMGLLQDISERKRAEEEIKGYVAKLERAVQSTIEVVSTIGELRDPYTHGHERRVGELAAAIGTEMGLDADRVEGLRVAGYLHDVGKISVPAEILAKPSRLSKVEFELVKQHAQQSYEILKGVAFPWPVAEVAWQHHERLDGSGYPRGLKGDAIILEARVTAVADVVEAMASHRPYRPGLGIDAALAEVEKGRGTIYDAQAADACARLFRDKAFKLSE